jgi:chaperone modulatory protein CbpM
MNTETHLWVGVEAVAQVADLPVTVVIDIVEHGIVEPVGAAPEFWQFDVNMQLSIKKAYQLHRELDVDWPGIALAMALLEQVDALKRENALLRQRLARFIP